MTTELMTVPDVAKRLNIPNANAWHLVNKIWKVKPAYSAKHGRGVQSFYNTTDMQPLIEKEEAKIGKAQKTPGAPASTTGVEAKLAVLTSQIANLVDAFETFEKNAVAQLSNQNRVLLLALEKHDKLIEKMLNDFGVKV